MNYNAILGSLILVSLGADGFGWSQIHGCRATYNLTNAV
jgi:hypothetical protein